MTGARIEVKLDDAPVQAVLRQLRTLAGDLTPLFQKIGDQVVTDTKIRFEHGRGPGGVPWKPSHRARMTGLLTLVGETGDLRRGINRRADADGVTVGATVHYAAIHQFGGVIKAKNAKALRFRIGDQWVTRASVTIPARPFLGIDDADRAEILAIATDHLHDATDGASG